MIFASIAIDFFDFADIFSFDFFRFSFLFDAIFTFFLRHYMKPHDAFIAIIIATG